MNISYLVRHLEQLLSAPPQSVSSMNSWYTYVCLVTLQYYDKCTKKNNIISQLATPTHVIDPTIIKITFLHNIIYKLRSTQTVRNFTILKMNIAPSGSSCNRIVNELSLEIMLNQCETGIKKLCQKLREIMVKQLR